MTISPVTILYPVQKYQRAGVSPCLANHPPYEVEKGAYQWIYLIQVYARPDQLVRRNSILYCAYVRAIFYFHLDDPNG